jgi:predicted alpha/beta hydrolase family esterase
MEKYILLHGSGNGPDMWLPWLKKELEKLGHAVWMPNLPDGENPDLKKQLPFLLDNPEVTPDCIIVGHSASCPLIFSLLENIEFKIKKAVLVAGYYKPLPKYPDANDPILKNEYDLEKIKNSCNDFLWVVSDNDPWGCGDEMGRPVFNQLGGTYVLVHDGGHFGSNSFKKPLYEFPLLLNLVK